MMIMQHDDDGMLDSGSAIELGALGATLGFALRRAQAAVTQDFLAAFANEEIRPTQFAVLTVLRNNPGLRQTQVSFALGIKRTNFVPVLDELERRGFTERRRVPGDRRAAALFLTAAGGEALDRFQAVALAHEARFATRLGAENRAALLGLLHRLADRSFDPEG